MRRRRAFRLAFVVAACLSFLLNAAVLGMAVRLASGGSGPFGGAGRMVTALPAEERRLLVGALRAHRERLAPLRERLADRRAELAEAMAETPRDPERLARAMARVREATTRLQRAAQDVVLEALVERRDAQGGDGRSSAEPARPPGEPRSIGEP
jgi:uncharacterized membrane protein